MTGLREHLVANLFDGDDQGQVTADFATLVDAITEIVEEYVTTSLAKGLHTLSEGRRGCLHLVSCVTGQIDWTSCGHDAVILSNTLGAA